MLALIILITVISVVFFTLLFAFQQKCQYWNRKNVPHLPLVSILGNFSDYILNKKFIGVLTQEICNKFRNEPYIGVYYGTDPTLIVQDPSFIKLVMAKHFNSFNGRELTQYNHKELLVQNLFFTYGDKWKILRQNLSPLFTTAKMKNMFYLIEKCSRLFENVLDKESKVVEIRSIMARLTMDGIGSCAFGVDTNTQEQKEGNPFSVIGSAIFDGGSFTSFRFIARSIWPGVFYGLGYKLFPKEIETFFYEILNRTFEGRNYKPTNRNDFIDLVLKVLENNESSEKKYNIDCQEVKQAEAGINKGIMMSQCFGIFAAGYETSATTLAFVLFELAKNLKAQEKVIQEVDAYLHRNNNVLKYECVAEMPYVNACIDEALRLYPVLATITREVTEDFIFPDGLKLEKGVRVHIPVYHLHYNPNYFPEPKKFKPERFFGDEKQNIEPYTYMPFGEGPRICIGIKFARMQMVVALITLLKKYRLELAADMKTELLLNPKSFVTSPVGGINLKFSEREGWEQRMLQRA